ncbi:MAG: hypothetical protein WD270_10320 [Acetobacterales bacterium]
MDQIAWSPPDSKSGLGAVLLPAAPGRNSLTPAQYRFALIGRIDRLVAKEPKERAARLLRVVEEAEGLDVASRPETAGEILVEYSDILTAMVQQPLAPVAGPLEHDPDAMAMLQEETLEEFLNRLYEGRR